MNIEEINKAFSKGEQVYWKNTRYKLVKMQHIYPWWCCYGIKDVYNDYLTALTREDLVDCFKDSNNA